MLIRHSITALVCALVTTAVSAQTMQSTMPMAGTRADTGRITTMGNTGQAQGQPGIYVEVPMQAQQNTATHTPAQDPSAYCYYADKSYSEGSRLRDQVCVRPGPSGGGYEASTELAPLRWISASQYARGHY